MSKRKSYIDENGEVTGLDEVWFREAKPALQIPEIAEILRRQGRPALPEAEKKQRVTIFLDRDVVERLKLDGKGWQTRANAKLRKALGL